MNELERLESLSREEIAEAWSFAVEGSRQKEDFEGMFVDELAEAWHAAVEAEQSEPDETASNPMMTCTA